MMYCPNCKIPARGNSKQFCMYCGTRCVDIPDPAERKRKIHNRIVLAIGLSIIPLLFLFIIFNTDNNTSHATINFKSIYSDYCSPAYATVGSDGSYLCIDTNPSDLEDYSNDDAVKAIVYVNIALGLPDYLLDDMGKTTALMGRQTETFEEVTVSWSYHPNNGLEVTYKKNR